MKTADPPPPTAHLPARHRGALRGAASSGVVHLRVLIPVPVPPSPPCSLTPHAPPPAALARRSGCEAALHPLCKPWLGTARLCWDEPANRPFFKALGRHMHSVARRGCPRTALELGRMLLSLAPERDPMHACLHLDHFALRAAAAVPADAAWVLRLPAAYRAHGLLLYPNYALSAAVALRVLGRTEAAAKQLRHAPPLAPHAPRDPHATHATHAALPPHTWSSTVHVA